MRSSARPKISGFQIIGGYGRLPGMFPPLSDLIWLVPAFLVGACIGSFLNVVIYRLPRGLSVNKPDRSFCPTCKTPIAMRHNLPVISWLWLRGRCAACGCRISFRYFGVELLTALLFVGLWLAFPPQVVLFLWLFASLLVAITFIDAEHLIIPLGLTWAGSVAGLVAALVWPRLPELGSLEEWTRWGGLARAVIGWVTGFFGLWAFVLLGKALFGRKRIEFGDAVDWSLREQEGDDQPLQFVIDGEAHDWWDLFYRSSDRLVIEGGEVSIDGGAPVSGVVVIRETAVELPDGRTVPMEDLKSLSGHALRVVIPREAMGMGDVHLMGMIGAYFGWAGVFFTLLAACIYALLAALIGRIGFGIRLPFGPFLALGALTWAFGAWHLWQTYLGMLGGW